MILNFTVVNLNICNEWLLTTSHLPCTQCEKACGSELQEPAVYIAFWKLCTAAVHVDTDIKINFRNVFAFKNYSLVEVINWCICWLDSIRISSSHETQTILMETHTHTHTHQTLRKIGLESVSYYSIKVSNTLFFKTTLFWLPISTLGSGNHNSNVTKWNHTCCLGCCCISQPCQQHLPLSYIWLVRIEGCGLFSY